MLTNIFTLFDPAYRSTFKLSYSINWLIPFLIILIIPIHYLSIKIRMNRLFTKISLLLITEFRGFIKKNKDLTSFIIIFCLFFIIAITNFTGLIIPYSFTPTTHIVFSLPFALIIFIGPFLIKLFNNFTKTLSHFLPKNLPSYLIVLIVLSETARFFARPFIISLRLTGNAIAGHLILYIVIHLAESLNLTIFLRVITISLLISLLEIFMCLIQSYIFIVLAIVYLAEGE